VVVGEVRSGLIEARHPVTAAAVADGRVIATLGDCQLDRPFYFRSAAKPFQSAVTQRNGAGLSSEELAVATGSHGGQPIHLAYVQQILAGAGLDETALQTPVAGHRSPSAVVRSGGARSRLFHNCSGKHAGMLKACVAAGWPVDTYAHPEHPLQVENREYMAECTGTDVGPVGVDGCGVPTFRGTVPDLAGAFARLATDPELAEVESAAYRFSSLTSDGGMPETVLSRWAGGTAKVGARAVLGFAWHGGVGIVAKCWTGTMDVAVMAVIEILRRLGLLPAYPFAMLAGIANPPVLGGGRRVGRLEFLEGAE
jgi:L-asparaginase II